MTPRGQKSWDAGLSGTKRDKTPVFAVVFGRRRGQMGIKTFVPRFSPIRRFSRRLGTVLTPGKACLKGLAALTTNTTQATIQAQIQPSSSWWRCSEPSRSASSAVGAVFANVQTPRCSRSSDGLVAALRPRAGLRENVPAVPVAVAEALGAAPHEGSRVTHVRGDCPARVPNLGPGCEGAREEAVGASCADAGRGFPRGVSAEADSDDSMTARASGVPRAPPRRDPRPHSSRPRGPRRRPRRPIGDAAPRASRASGSSSRSPGRVSPLTRRRPDPTRSIFPRLFSRSTPEMRRFARRSTGSTCWPSASATSFPPLARHDCHLPGPAPLRVVDQARSCAELDARERVHRSAATTLAPDSLQSASHTPTALPSNGPQRPFKHAVPGGQNRPPPLDNRRRGENAGQKS